METKLNTNKVLFDKLNYYFKGNNFDGQLGVDAMHSCEPKIIELNDLKK
jgi:hypothetical protein